MKKLMFVAALAATTVAFGEAQVYQARIAARTTIAMTDAKEISTNDNPFVAKNLTGKEAVYRTPTQYVLNGLIWGCDCDTITGNYGVDNTVNGTNIMSGAMFWIPKTMTYVFGTDQSASLGWQFINAIGKTGNQCEGCFAIQPKGACKNDVTGALMFSGFGTLGRTSAAKGLNCTYYVASISGSFAGYLPAPTVVGGGKDCTYCTPTIPDECVDSVAWDWCVCTPTAQQKYTAAYGEWYIRYNAAMSAALKNSTHVGQVYDFGGRSDKNDVWKNYVKRFIVEKTK